jgi:hypothetical protein
MEKTKYLFLIAALVLLINGSCEKTINVAEKPSCILKDPINDLPWLKAKIDSAAKPTSQLGVFSYDYDSSIIFEITDNHNEEPRSGLLYTLHRL